MLPRRGLLSALLASPVLGLAAGRMRQAHARPLPPARTRVLEFNVAGSYYYGFGGAEGSNDALLRQRVQLRRAPLNPYDPLAIEVTFEDRVVGHVPRPHNELLARLIDAGDRFEGRVVALDEGSRPLRVALDRLGS